MAFGNSVMARFSEESVPLDSAYESLLDGYSELDAFMDIVCEGADYDPYDVDDIDEDDYDEYDEDDDEDEFDDECCEDDDEDLEACRESFDNMTPQQKFASYCKMVNNNPRFSPEKKKEMIENYKKNHPEAADEPATESFCYDRAEACLDRVDQLLADMVGDAYDEPEYGEPKLSDHAEFSSKLSTGMSRLHEPLPGINDFAGDSQAPFAASLRTHYARESAFDDIESYDDAISDALESASNYIDAVDTNTDDIGEYDDIDAGLEGCKTALESMIAELDSLTNN